MVTKIRSTLSQIAILLCTLASTHSSAFAAVEFESETPEFESRISPEEAHAILNAPNVYETDPPISPELQDSTLKRLKNQGKWAFKFVWIKDNGDPVTLSEQNSSVLHIHASLQKVVTGWVGYQKKVATLETLSNMLKTSDNVQAETVFEDAGGKTGIMSYLSENVSIPLPGPLMTIVDGSGESVKNRMTPNGMIQLLTHIHSSAEYNTYRSLLAEPGDEVSTLRSRLLELEGSLFAKTGTMPNTRVVSLGGYVETKVGTLVFTIIANQYPLPLVKVWSASQKKYIWTPSKSEGIKAAREKLDATVLEHANWLNSQSESL